MIRFRASGLLAIWFFISAYHALCGQAWMNMGFDIIVGLCLAACYFNKPLHIGNIIEFGGW